MHAVTISKPGDPEVLQWTEVPDPAPGAGELLIEVVAAGVNRADLLQRAGSYDPPPGASPYPGMEISGRVIDANGVDGWSEGDEVCALLAGGGYAEKVAAPAGHVLKVPAGVGLVEAAALPEVACTVWSNLIMAADLREGQSVLIHGGGSGIGTFAIQFARSLHARIITTARAAKHEALLSLGADTVIDYESQDFVSEVRTATGGRGADVILDIMGASYLKRNLASLAMDGRLVIIGLQGGRIGQIDLGGLLAKRGAVIGTMLRSRDAADKARIVAGVRDNMWPLIQKGEIRPIVDRSLPMSRADVAHRVLAASEHIGKVLLVPDGRAQAGHNK